MPTAINLTYPSTPNYISCPEINSVGLGYTGGGGAGTVTNIATTSPIQGGPITTTGTIGITKADTSTVWYPAFQGFASTPVSSVTFNFGQNAWSATTAGLRASLLLSGYNIGLY
jgi:hypothetical protein